MRNYFNLVFLHNTLVDLAVFNNAIYNDLLNNLNKTLVLTGFKINTVYDADLHVLLKKHNKDTTLLDALFNAPFYKSFFLYKKHKSAVEWFNVNSKVVFKLSRRDYNVKANTTIGYSKALKNLLHKPTELLAHPKEPRKVFSSGLTFYSLFREFITQQHAEDNIDV